MLVSFANHISFKGTFGWDPHPGSVLPGSILVCTTAPCIRLESCEVSWKKGGRFLPSSGRPPSHQGSVCLRPCQPLLGSCYLTKTHRTQPNGIVLRWLWLVGTSHVFRWTEAVSRQLIAIFGASKSYAKECLIAVMLQMSPRHPLNTHQKIRYTKFTEKRVHLRIRNEVQQMGIYVTLIQASSNRSVKVLVWLDHKDFWAKCLDLTWHIMERKALLLVSTWTEGNIPLVMIPVRAC